jgi:hypothetical protein
VQINWTLVAGLAACSLAAAANWDAGTAAGPRRGPWRGLAIVYWLLTVELVLDLRFALIGAGMVGSGRHAMQLGAALAMLAIAAAALVMIGRAGRRTPEFAFAGVVAVAMALLFGVEMLAVGAIGALLYRPVGPLLLIGWLWLAVGATAVAIAVAAVRRTRAR